MEKQLIIWSEVYSVGIEEIDKQHRVLVDLINKVYNQFLDKNYDEIKNVMLEIKEYTLYHFSAEEKLFREKQYKNAQEHIQFHEDLIEQLNELHTKYLDSPGLMTLKTMTFLQRWLTQHILKEDKKYIGYLN